jgi:centrin-1
MASAAAASTAKKGATASSNPAARRAVGAGSKDSRLKLELSEKQRAELRQAFDHFDSEGTGRIKATEIKVALRALGFEPRKEVIRGLLAEVGCDPAGHIDFNEFCTILLLKMAERESKEEVLNAYKLFDLDDKGYITFEDLKSIHDQIGMRLTDDEIKEMMVFAHPKGKKDNTGKERFNVGEEDFLRLMKRANVY